MTAIQDAAQDIATRVHTTIAAYSKLGVELTTTQALDDVIDERIQNARDARARHGQWQNATSSTDIEDALFAATVARDVRDNTFRPSTGPLGDYVRSLLALT